eukprot:COSAG04_NODE_256_length_18763_cov_60.353140_12_plen_87_part_00
MDTQPEAVLAGAGMCMALAVMQKPPLGKALSEAGFLSELLVCYTDVMQRYNPMERISKSNLVAAGISSALNLVFEGVGAETTTAVA